jgi:hypothetical protein
MGLPNPAMRKPESNDDRHVMAKHAEIYPSVWNHFLVQFSKIIQLIK